MIEVIGFIMAVLNGAFALFCYFNEGYAQGCFNLVICFGLLNLLRG